MVEKLRLWRKILHAAVGIPGRLILPGQNAPQQHRDCASPVGFSVAENDPRAIAVGSLEHS
jgi:hypothetical protein